jgi:hypothetical protein
MNTRLHELNVKIAGCEYTLKNHFAQPKSKLKEITTQILTESAILFRHQIKQTIREKTIEFEQHLTGVLDEMIQDVYTAADEAHDTLQTTSQQLVNEFQDKIKEKKGYGGKRFYYITTKSRKCTGVSTQYITNSTNKSKISQCTSKHAISSIAKSI